VIWHFESINKTHNYSQLPAKKFLLSNLLSSERGSLLFVHKFSNHLAAVAVAAAAGFVNQRSVSYLLLPA